MNLVILQLILTTASEEDLTIGTPKELSRIYNNLSYAVKSHTRKTIAKLIKENSNALETTVRPILREQIRRISGARLATKASASLAPARPSGEQDASADALVAGARLAETALSAAPPAVREPVGSRLAAVIESAEALSDSVLKETFDKNLLALNQFVQITSFGFLGPILSSISTEDEVNSLDYRMEGGMITDLGEPMKSFLMGYGSRESLARTYIQNVARAYVKISDAAVQQQALRYLIHARPVLGARLAKRDIIDLLNEEPGEGSTDEVIVRPADLFTMRLAEIFSTDPWIKRLEAADKHFPIQLERGLERYTETDPTDPSREDFLAYLVAHKDGAEALVYRIYGEIQDRVIQDRTDLAARLFRDAIRHDDDWRWIQNFIQKEWKLSPQDADRLTLAEALSKLQASKANGKYTERRMAQRILQDFVGPWAKRSYDHELDLRMQASGSLEGFLRKTLEGARLAQNVSVGAHPGKKNAQDDAFTTGRIFVDGLPNGQGELMAVFDGHNDKLHPGHGGEMARRAADQLKPVFRQALKDAHGDVEKAMVWTVERLHVDLQKHLGNLSGGTTAAIVYVTDFDAQGDAKATAAVLGDSSVHVRDAGGVSVRLPVLNVNSSKDASGKEMNKERETVKDRARDLGKTVYEDPDHPYHLGYEGVLFQTTRSLGDFDLPFLDRTPVVRTFDVKRAVSSVVVATDGVPLNDAMEALQSHKSAKDLVNNLHTRDNRTAVIWRSGARLAAQSSPETVDLAEVFRGSVDLAEMFLRFKDELAQKARSKEGLSEEDRARFKRTVDLIRSKIRVGMFQYIDWTLERLRRHISSGMERQLDILIGSRSSQARKTESGMASFPIMALNDLGAKLNVPGLGDLFLNKMDAKFAGVSVCDLGTRRYFLNVDSMWMKTEIRGKAEEVVKEMVLDLVRLEAARKGLSMGSEKILSYQIYVEELLSEIPSQIYGSHGELPLKETPAKRDPLSGLSPDRRKKLEDGDFNAYTHEELKKFNEELTYFKEELGHLPDNFENFDRGRVTKFNEALQAFLVQGVVQDFQEDLKNRESWATGKKNLYESVYDAYRMYRREILAHTATYYIENEDRNIAEVIDPATRKYLEQRMQVRELSTRYVAASYAIAYWMDYYAKLFQRLEVIEPQKLEDRAFRDVVMRVTTNEKVASKQIPVLDDAAARYGMKEELAALGPAYLAMYFRKLHEGELKATPLLDYHSGRLPRPLSDLRVVGGPKEGVLKQFADKPLRILHGLLDNRDPEKARDLVDYAEMLKKQYLDAITLFYDLILKTYHDPRLREILQQGLMHEIVKAIASGEVERMTRHIEAILADSGLDKGTRSYMERFLGILKRKVVVFRRHYGDEFGILLPAEGGHYRLVSIELKRAHDFFARYRPDRLDSVMNEILLEFDRIAQEYAFRTEEKDLAEMVSRLRSALKQITGHMPFNVTEKAPVHGEVSADPAFVPGFTERQPAFIMPTEGEEEPDYPNVLVSSENTVLYRRSLSSAWEDAKTDPAHLIDLGARRFRDTLDLRANYWDSLLTKESVLETPRLIHDVFYKQEVALNLQKKRGAVFARVGETGDVSEPQITDLTSLITSGTGARLAGLAPEISSALEGLFPKIYSSLAARSKNRKAPLSELASDPAEIREVALALMNGRPEFSILREDARTYALAVLLYLEEGRNKNWAEIYAGWNWAPGSKKRRKDFESAFVAGSAERVEKAGAIRQRRQALVDRLDSLTDEEARELEGLYAHDDPARGTALLGVYYGLHDDLANSDVYYQKLKAYPDGAGVFNNVVFDRMTQVFEAKAARPVEEARRDIVAIYLNEPAGLPPTLVLPMKMMMDASKQILAFLNGRQDFDSVQDWIYPYEEDELNALSQALVEEGLNATAAERVRRVMMRRLLTSRIVDMTKAVKDKKFFNDLEEILRASMQDVLLGLRSDYFVYGLEQTFDAGVLRKTLETLEAMPMKTLDEDDLEGRRRVMEELKPLLLTLKTTDEAMTLAAFLEAKGRTPQAREILKAAIAVEDGEEAVRKILWSGRSHSLKAAFDALPEWVRENHENTAFYAVMAGQKMGLDDARLRNLYVASFLHDTGKVKVPDHILNKPGPLTPEEKKVMEEHVTHSLQIIGAVPADVFESAGVSQEQVLRTIAAYHEEPDGSGYPKGLKGTEFTADSAILHAADSIDAMMSPRPYQAEPQPLQAVLHQLRASIGAPAHAKFEPEVARIFLEILSPRDRAAGLFGRGARLSALKEFYERQVRRTAGREALFVPASIDAVVQSLSELERRFGSLRGKTLLDLGAGDLRVGLAAAVLFGMKATAVEKDARIYGQSAEMLEAAVAEGLVRKEDVALAGPRDALDVPWTQDVVFFYYVQPEGLEGEVFRKRLEEKILRETGPDNHFVMLLTKAQWEHYNRQEFETLKPVSSVPALIYHDLGEKDGKGVLYLMLYRGQVRGARLADLSAALKKFETILAERSGNDKAMIEQWLRAYQKHYLLASSPSIRSAGSVEKALSRGHYKDGTAVQATTAEVEHVVLVKEILSDPEISAATLHDKNRENELVTLALAWVRFSGDRRGGDGARLAKNFIGTAKEAESADPETLVLIARSLLDIRRISKATPFLLPLGNALIRAELDKKGETGVVDFYSKSAEGEAAGKPFARVKLTKAIVDEARKLKDKESVLRLKLADRSEALDAFADDQKTTAAARQFYAQLKKSKAPDVEFNNDRTVVLRFVTEQKLRPEKMELYRAQLRTLHAIAGRKVLLQFAQIGKEGGPVLYGPSDPDPAKGEDFALFHLSELSEKALEAAQGQEAGFVSVEGLTADETIIPFVAQGVFLAAVGRLSGYTDSVQQLWRNVRGAEALRDLDPAAFADIRKVLTVDLGRYSELQLRTIDRIVWEKVLEYTRLALQAVGSAA
jgi:HD-GYP domain-containing protein (c-di-GMP phosphodiesterase class II)